MCYAGSTNQQGGNLINITGEIKHDNGEVSQFSVSSADYTQWGAPTETLGETVDLMWEMMVALDKIENGEDN